MYSGKTNRSHNAPAERAEKTVRQAHHRNFLCVYCGKEFRAPTYTAQCQPCALKLLAPRACLKCGTTFKPQGRFNKLCLSCHQDNARVGRIADKADYAGITLTR